MPSSSHLTQRLKRGAFELGGRVALLGQALQTPLALVEVGEHQLGLYSGKRAGQSGLIAGELGDYDQQRVEVADKREQARVERGALLLLLGVGGEIKHGELDFDPLLGAVGALEEIQPLIGDFNLARTGAIAPLALPGQWSKSGKRVEDGRFAHAACADNSGLQK